MISELVSIIVPGSREDTLPETVHALLNQTVLKEKCEIILVVPYWLNCTKCFASKVKIIKTSNLFPPGKMRNIGAKNASGKIYFFIDDDCIPPTHWVETVSNIFVNDSTIGAVGCRLVGIENAFWSRCADYALFSTYQYFNAFDGAIGSAAIAVRREAFKDVNGFEETLFASEDWEFSIKLIENAWKCRFEPAIEVQHNHQRGSLRGILDMGFRSGYRSGLFVQEKHKKKISIAANILLKFKKPYLYPFVIVPYTFLLTTLLTLKLKPNNSNIYLYVPFIFLSRFAYQIGVWSRLITNGLRDGE